jgi:2-iminobutanoate/2-iminopropanoate deaminase
MKLQRIVVAGMCLVLCLAASVADRKYIVGPKPANATALPFSDGVLVGNTLYIAGHLGLDPKTGMPPAGAEDEAKAVMDGVKQTVESAGLTMDDIVSLQIFCTDLKQYEAFNAIYKTYFHGNYPARAFLGADKLVRGARFEVMGTAIKRAE